MIFPGAAQQRASMCFAGSPALYHQASLKYTQVPLDRNPFDPVFPTPDRPIVPMDSSNPRGLGWACRVTHVTHVSPYVSLIPTYPYVPTYHHDSRRYDGVKESHHGCTRFG